MGIYKKEQLERANSVYLSDLPEEDRRVVNRYLSERIALDKLSLRRVHRILQSIKLVRAHLPCSFERVEKDQIMGFLAWLEQTPYTGYTKLTHEVIFRHLLRWLGKDVSYFKLRRNIKRPTHTVLSEQDVLKLISHCTSIRDKCLVSLLWESGARIGEIGELKIKDISFEKLGTRLNLFGKTGQRSILVVAATPYLLDLIKIHPQNKPNSYLFVTNKKNSIIQLPYDAIRKALMRTAERAGLSKKINPHWFRHSRATDLAKRWTEAQMKIYLGWDMHSDMPATYVHLSGRDVDSAVLRDRGIVEKTTSAIPLPYLDCPRCKHQNGIAEHLCSRCGALLKLDEFEKVKNQEREDMRKMMLEIIKNTKINE